jgi:hypothetical protein
MPQTAAEFLSDLERRALVPPGVLASLQSQVAKAAAPVAPAAVAKLLVEKGHLTSAQAQQLLGALSTATAQAAPPKAAGPKADHAELALADDLEPPGGLEPLDDLPLENLPTDDLTPLGEGQPLEDLPPLDALEPLPQPAPAAAVIPLDDLAALDPLTPASPSKSAKGKSRSGAAAHPGASVSPPGAMRSAAPTHPARRSSALGLIAALLVAVVLIGGGAAGAMLLIPRGGGAEAFAAAEGDYQSQQYDAAAAKYEAFLADHPASQHAPLARVRLAAARVLAARTASPQNWQLALAAAKEHLPAVAGLAEFSQVHGEIAPLVMDMAAELADEVTQAPATAEKVSAAREALALAGDGRIVPAAVRQWQRLDLAADSLAVAAYGAERSAALEAGLAAIKKGAEAGEVEVAFAEREKLLSTYPDLAGDSSLREVGLDLANNAKSKVQTAEYSVAAETTEQKTGILGSVVVAAPLKTVAASEAGPPAVFAALSSVWSIDSASGRLLWRRGASGQCVRLAADATSGVLLASADGRELIHVDSRLGTLKWRHSLEAPLAGAPLVLDRRVIVTTRAGQVLALDAQTGGGQMSAQLPQLARVGPVADAAGKYLMQVADHSLLYVLAAADLACERAVYVGHESAAVTTSPVLLPKQLVVTENRGYAASALHVMALDGGGLPESVVQQIQLAGHVLAPPVVLSGKLVVATNEGRVTAYESAAKPTSGLKEVAKADVRSMPDSAKGIARYPLLAGDKLLVAGRGVSLLAGPAGGTLKPVWEALGDDVLIAPPQVAGNTIVALRRAPGRPRVIAAGLNVADGKPRWETLLGVSAQRLELAGDKTSLDVVTADGRTAKVKLTDLERHQVVSLAPATKPGTGAATAPVHRFPVQRLPWRDGQIVISPAGTISYVDSATGALKAEPLQLRLKPGMRLADCRASAVGERKTQLAISDGHGTLTLVDLAGEGGQQLVELASASLESPPISGLAVGDGALGIVDRRGKLVTYSLPDLQPGATVDLAASAILAGPTRVGESVVLITDRGDAVGLDRSLAHAWKTPLVHGAPAGDLAAGEFGLILACRNGWLCKLDSQSGKERAAVDVGEPLAGTPLVVGDNVIVATTDGAILKVALPAQSEAAP